MPKRLLDKTMLLVFLVSLFTVAIIVLIATSPWLFTNWILDDAQAKE